MLLFNLFEYLGTGMESVGTYGASKIQNCCIDASGRLSDLSRLTSRRKYSDDDIDNYKKSIRELISAGFTPIPIRSNLVVAVETFVNKATANPDKLTFKDLGDLTDAVGKTNFDSISDSDIREITNLINILQDAMASNEMLRKIIETADDVDFGFDAFKPSDVVSDVIDVDASYSSSTSELTWMADLMCRYLDKKHISIDDFKKLIDLISDKQIQDDLDLFDKENPNRPKLKDTIEDCVNDLVKDPEYMKVYNDKEKEIDKINKSKLEEKVSFQQAVDEAVNGINLEKLMVKINNQDK